MWNELKENVNSGCEKESTKEIKRKKLNVRTNWKFVCSERNVKEGKRSQRQVTKSAGRNLENNFSELFKEIRSSITITSAKQMNLVTEKQGKSYKTSMKSEERILHRYAKGCQWPDSKLIQNQSKTEEVL